MKAQITQNHGGYATMRITTNGTTISGSLSEVLATLTHITQLTAPADKVTAEPVTTPEVASITVTPDEAKAVAKALVAKLGAEATPVPVPKPARDSVIQQAISDVEDLLSRNHDDGFVDESLWFVSEGGLYTVTDEVLFTVNADKRTVIAVIRHNRGRHKVLSNGRAKCAPTDIFNEHIGKAIALRRAIGLAVPVEYFEVEARDSDDLAVGDVVRCGWNDADEVNEIIELIDNPKPALHKGMAFKLTRRSWAASSQVTLINDSARHTAPDLEVSRIIRH